MSESFKLLLDELKKVSAVFGSPSTEDVGDSSDQSEHILEKFITVWKEPTHRAVLMGNIHADQLMRFISLLTSDTARLMDTMIGDLTCIRAIEQEMQDTEAWEAQPLQYRQDRESALRTLELHAPHDVYLAGSALEILKAFAGEEKVTFSDRAIAERLAATLNHALDALVGPSCQELAVRHPGKYRWEPKEMLGHVLDIYFMLGGEDAFKRAMAADRQSFRKGLLERACAIAERRAIRSTAELNSLLALVSRVEEQRAELTD